MPTTLDARPPSGSRATVVPRLVAPLLAAAVFSIDTFTDIHGAVAVLYVLVLLLAGGDPSRRGIVRLGAFCLMLTVLSFLVVHGRDADPSSVLRCATALAAIAITTALLLRDHASRQRLVDANAALSRSEARYRAIFDQARFSLWEQDFSRLERALARLRDTGVTDLDAHARANPGFVRDCVRLITTTDVNDATVELLGTGSRAGTTGPVDRFVPVDEPGLIEVLRAVSEGRRRLEGRGSLMRADGRRLTVLFGFAFPDDDAYERVVVSIVDVTEREATQEALMAARAELACATRAATVGALSASIAHELNQPLGALVMNAQTCLRWLRRDPPNVEAAAKAAERTARDGKRASEIVQRTRSRVVEGGRREQPVDLRAMTEELATLLERELAAGAARLVVTVADGVPPALADPVEMQQVLVNLVTNAIHAMADDRAPDRELTVVVDSPAPDRVRVTVRDRGTGIAQDILPRLFDPFFTTRSDGMGMGLAICRSVVEAAGGEMTAENHPDGGAVFRFTVPAAISATAEPGA